MLGNLVCRYAYDAVGRLMWKRTPTNEGLTALQRKDYYYDGVRRIQENIARPTLLMPDGGGSGGGGGGGGTSGGGGTPEEPELAGWPGNDELPVQMLGGGQQIILGPPELFCEEPPMPLGTLYWTDREYVYGPGYVDEFILQIDQGGNILYMLQDANYNVVAIISGGCGPGVPPENCGTGVPPVGTLLEQYAYDPYGTVIAADNLDVDEYGVSQHAVNRVGFQGLFFERYDGDYTVPCIAPDVSGMYYARNRFYSPALGRFLQRDPNETGIPIIAALVMNGEAVSILFGGFDAQGLYGDGMNLYLFAGANPVMWRDPSGLNSAGAVGSLGLGAVLYTTAMQVGCAVLGAAAKVKGIALAYAWMMTAFMLMSSNNMPAISTAAAEYGEDYVHLDRMWQAAKKTGSECWGSFTRAIGGSSGSIDPNRLPGGWERFRHTLTRDKACKWFGISDPSKLSSRQIQEWQDLLAYALRSERTFNWDSHGAPTIGRLVFVDGKYLCVQVYQATGHLATAFIPNPAELEAMKRAMGW